MEIRIGKQLTQAREALGLIVEDVAHRTKIPATIIRRLEREDYSHFPNNVYAKSFLRLYGKHLGIDASEYIAGREGRLMSHEDEVSFLEGIAISPEFQNIEEKQAAATSTAAAHAAASATGEVVPGKVSSGFMTVFLILVVGLPTAFLLNKLYEGDGDGETAEQPPPAEVAPGDGEPGPAPETELETPIVPPEPEPVAEIVIDDTATPGPDAISVPAAIPLEEPVGVPAGIPVGDPEIIPEIPRAIGIEEPTPPSSDTADNTPLAVE